MIIKLPALGALLVSFVSWADFDPPEYWAYGDVQRGWYDEDEPAGVIAQFAIIQAGHNAGLYRRTKLRDRDFGRWGRVVKGRVAGLPEPILGNDNGSMREIVHESLPGCDDCRTSYGWGWNRVVQMADGSIVVVPFENEVFEIEGSPRSLEVFLVGRAQFPREDSQIWEGAVNVYSAKGRLNGREYTYTIARIKNRENDGYSTIDLTEALGRQWPSYTDFEGGELEVVADDKRVVLDLSRDPAGGVNRHFVLVPLDPASLHPNADGHVAVKVELDGCSVSLVTSHHGKTD